jgi:histidinol dehydrogenase
MTLQELMPQLRVFGRLSDLSPGSKAALLDRATRRDEEVRLVAHRIIERVRRGGDTALRELATELDGVSLDAIEVPQEKWQEALAQIRPRLRRAMERAAANIDAVQTAFLPTPEEVRPEPGISIVRRPDPLRRVGVYAPGGRAAYASSVMMGAIPARVAGVKEIVLCSPPDRTGVPSQFVLAAAELSGVHRVFSVGGAGAIAALAYGTNSIPRVDRIVGPGNSYVTEAKLQVAGVTGIDMPAGPSELLIIADLTASVGLIAREVFAQAEHDPEATVVVLTLGSSLAAQVAEEIAREAASQPRTEIIISALSRRGAVLSADSIGQAVAFANAFAPEHVLLACSEQNTIAPLLRNVGTVFLGETSSVTFGDYMTGANHVLPTGGLAKCYSGLSVLDFVRWTTLQRIDRDAAASIAEDVAIFADAEGLPGHAIAARNWVRA